MEITSNQNLMNLRKNSTEKNNPLKTRDCLVRSARLERAAFRVGV